MICLLRKASYNAVYKHTYVAVRIQQPADGEFFRQIFLEWGQNNVPFVYLIGFFLWIWAEIEAFVALGDAVGVLLTLIGIFVTGMIGISLLRSQGRRIAGELQSQLARGEAPVASLAAGVSSLFGAILMLIPGYLTDACGLILFLPVIRTLAGAMILQRIAARGSFAMRGGMPFGGASSFGFQSGTGARERTGEWARDARRTDVSDDDVIEGDAVERPLRDIPHKKD